MFEQSKNVQNVSLPPFPFPSTTPGSKLNEKVEPKKAIFFTCDLQTFKKIKLNENLKVSVAGMHLIVCLLPVPG